MNTNTPPSLYCAKHDREMVQDEDGTPPYCGSCWLESEPTFGTIEEIDAPESRGRQVLCWLLLATLVLLAGWAGHLILSRG